MNERNKIVLFSFKNAKQFAVEILAVFEEKRGLCYAFRRAVLI
jgi:hypothetical protein